MTSYSFHIPSPINVWTFLTSWNNGTGKIWAITITGTNVTTACISVQCLRSFECWISPLDCVAQWRSLGVTGAATTIVTCPRIQCYGVTDTGSSTHSYTCTTYQHTIYILLIPGIVVRPPQATTHTIIIRYLTYFTFIVIFSWDKMVKISAVDF